MVGGARGGRWGRRSDCPVVLAVVGVMNEMGVKLGGGCLLLCTAAPFHLVVGEGGWVG